MRILAGKRACQLALLATAFLSTFTVAAGAPSDQGPMLHVLGIAQDGGVPQAGDPDPARWSDASSTRSVVSLGVSLPSTKQRWLFEATPDLPEQLASFDRLFPVEGAAPRLAGIFLTHGHIGHYTGLMFLGHEAMGARDVPVFAMPRMAAFLSGNGPWSQLVRYRNIELVELEDRVPVVLAEALSVTPFLVPHRQEFTEVVGYRIDGPRRSVLFIPDIDSWEEWDQAGHRIEAALAEVDVAYLDATFFMNGEIPGRDMSGFPHPFVRHTMDRLAPLPAETRAKVRFIHLNHTNPALDEHSDAHGEIIERGFRVAREGERVDL
ncbi:MAG: MBL fold metallo-hydrolase [Pseudomonadales bacterium]|jgi:pyrroloquinoline quinone biosynthesis protein B|nr:MBL fold metallo-hydrolase [Pseudomonadales bacterium]